MSDALVKLRNTLTQSDSTSICAKELLESIKVSIDNEDWNGFVMGIKQLYDLFEVQI